MKLRKAFALLIDLRLALQNAFIPTIWAIWSSPELLLRPQELSRVFMSHVWIAFGNVVDDNGREVKNELITPNAQGVVLDIGAGMINYVVAKVPPSRFAQSYHHRL